MNKNLPQRPTFDKFRDILLEQLNLINESNIQDPFYKWKEIGSAETRLKILKGFYSKISELYGLEMETDNSLAELDGFIESVVVQIYHAYSTMHLVERINTKIRAKMN